MPLNKETKSMQSLDLNPIDNIQSIVKSRIYKGGKQFATKNEFWEAILAVC